ncbi:MAG: tRNA (adenosine(37)-N6)-threonylcarbamoyltransferase complex ATPase subunit type 1 TsaE [Sphingomonas sp.]
MEARLFLGDEAASLALGKKIAGYVAPGDVITLSGPLGAGKTSIARGMLAALGLRTEAPSPSFAIVQPYDPPEVRLPVRHVDLYRVENIRDLVELGLDEDAVDSVLLIEWPERAGDNYWPNALALRIDVLPSGGRALTVAVPAAWKARWP